MSEEQNVVAKTDFVKVDVSTHPKLKGFQVRQFTTGQKSGQYQVGTKVSRRERRITYAYGNSLDEAYQNWEATAAIHQLRQAVISVHAKVFQRNVIRDAANGNVDPRLLLLANRFLLVIPENSESSSEER